MKKSFFFKSLAILAMFGMSFNYGIAQDAFAGAGTISYNDTITADITGATPDGPLASCWLEGPVDGDIWYGFTATGVGVKVTTFQTAGGLTDPQVAIYEWDGAGLDPLVNLTEVGCDEDGADAFHSLATACDLTPGNPYFIQVDSWAGEPGEFQMLLEDFPADSCAAVCVADDCVGGTLTGLVDGSYCSTDILEFTYDGASLATDPNCTTELAIFYTPNTDSLTAAGGPFGDGSGAYCTSFCYPDFSGTLTIGASNYGAFNLTTPATGDWWVYGAVVVDGGPTICATTDTIN
ncbi:MAG: hypothetical protein HKO93_06755, partial [Flavobacteriales bacterium]|nr:hypothetical protein [Flavobacteriales bacterium]